MPSVRDYGYELNRLPQADLNRVGSPDITANIPLSSVEQQIMDGSMEIGKLGVKSGQPHYAVGTGFWLGVDEGVPKFSIGNPTSYFRWDGTNVTISGDITAGTLTVTGIIIKGAVLKNMPIMIREVDSDIANPVQNTVLNTSTSNIAAITFIEGTASVWFQIKVPDAWLATDDIIFAMSYENASAGGNIRWQLEYWVITNGGDTTPSTSPTATKNETIAAASSTETLKNIQTTSLAIANGDITSTDDIVICKLTRLGDDAADTNTGSLHLIDLKCFTT